MKEYDYYMELIQSGAFATPMGAGGGEGYSPSNYIGTRGAGGEEGYGKKRKKKKKKKKSIIKDKSGTKTVTDSRLNENQEKGLWNKFFKTKIGVGK